MMAQIPFFGSLGNHEYYTDSADSTLDARVTPTARGSFRRLRPLLFIRRDRLLKRLDEPSVRSGGVRAPILLLCAVLLALPAGARAEAAGREEAAALLDRFRSSIWAVPIYAEFELREMPRRGDEHVFRGRFWGGRNEKGPVTRFEVGGSRGGPATRTVLLQGGPGGGLWTADGQGPGVPDPDAVLKPVVPGVEITPFDLLPMPYLYWLDADFVGAERVRGRQAYVYLLAPSADFAARNPGIRAVRVYLDGQYEALEQSEVVGTGGPVTKTLSLLELRKVGSQWIPKDVDVRTEGTRDKTRLTLTAVAVGITIDPAAFDPSLLGTPAAPPAAALIVPVPQ